MTTLHAPDVGVRPERPGVTKALWLIVGILAAGLLALGTWVLVDRYTGPERDATALIDDLATAWSTGDVDAISALYTSDAVLVTAWGSRYIGVKGIAYEVPGAASIGFEVERIAPVTVEGDLATTFIRYSDASGEEGTLLSVFQLENGKILRQFDFAPGVTPPLDAIR
jgi:hypothetical protein